VRQLSLATSWDLRLVGGSRAGEGSLVLLPQLRLSLDAGRPARALVPLQHVVVSHGHLDHLLGLPAWASQRQLQGIPGGTVWADRSQVAAVKELLAVVARLEGGKPYDVEVRAVAAGDHATLRPGFELAFFATSHWVPTLGCRVDWVRKHLRPEHAALPPEELRRLREAGAESPECSAAGRLRRRHRTGGVRARAVADRRRVLVTECTFLRRTTSGHAARWSPPPRRSVALAPRLACRHLVLTHLSRRHRIAAGNTRIRRALADLLRPELHLLNVEWL
jgi:ribonuclease Z